MSCRRGIALSSLALLLLWQPRAEAAFHEWDIAEVYSNADGSVQYIELFTSMNGQHVLATHTLTATWTGGNTSTFTFPTNSPTGTTNKRLLIATPGFAKLPGAIAPDFTLPCGPFFDPGATSITLNFAGFDSVTFAGSALPVNGDDSLNDTGAASLVSAAATPENFAGTDGTLNLTTCQVAGTCEPCDDGLFCNGAESCSAFACVATGACTQICDEDQDTCVECDDPGDCNDNNVCTDDACDTGVCENTPNTAACNDGLFCTQTDACSAGICVGSGDPCAGQNCSEGVDACVDCNSPADCNDANPCTDDLCNGGECSHLANTADCDDGLFCTMNDQCSAGACAGSGDACAGRICDEAGDACLDCDEDGDCDDGAECTSDACVDGACEHTNVTLGTPCQSDGTFCNGPEQCVSGACDSLGDPCGAATTCDEASNACAEPDEPEAGGAGPGSAGAGSGAGAAGGMQPEPSEGGSGNAVVGGRPSETPMDDDADTAEDEGCGCRVAGHETSRDGWLALVALCGLALRRSRRRS
ncbi:MAG TPA: hypothetical protein VJN18_00090 [Polyangiaceae bacterium]|nr:hypothetical protein [Polyangiaceae bacterium]